MPRRRRKPVQKPHVVTPDVLESDEGLSTTDRKHGNKKQKLDHDKNDSSSEKRNSLTETDDWIIVPVPDETPMDASDSK